jgi:hypothetical protein
MATLSALQTLAAKNVKTELDLETQATIMGLAIKVSNNGVPYFTRDTAVAIKAALVKDGLVGKDVVLFEKLKTTQPDAWFKPVGDWLELGPVPEEAETI